MIMRAVSRRNPPGRVAGLVGTLVVHAAAASLLFATVRPPPKPSRLAYAVDLVAAPAPAPKKRVAREAVMTPTPPVEKPAPVQPKPAPNPEPKPAPKAEPKPAPKPPIPKPAEPKPQPAEPVNREPAPETQASVAPAPGETPGTGTDAATIKTPGLAFPFPQYLRNIVNQVYHRWDRSAATRSLSAEISFLILSDGGVRDIRFVTRSGSFSFDLNAQGAIEAAGRARAFGPLPTGWEAEVLPVSILFKPIR